MGQDKATIVVDGETLIDRAVRVLSTVADDVVVCGGPHNNRYEVVADAIPDAGPLGGVVSALHRAQGNAALVLAVDLPLVGPQMLTRLATALVREDQAVVVRQAGGLQPLCGVYGPDLSGVAHDRLHTRDRSMRSFLRSIPLLTAIDVDGPTVWNINTPEDLERLRELSR